MSFRAKIPPQTVPVMKVIRINMSFVCGMCRTPYGSAGLADKCLNKCLDIFTAQTKPVAFTLKGNTMYRCVFCARTHPLASEVEKCMENCRVKMQQKVHELRNPRVAPVAGEKAPAPPQAIPVQAAAVPKAVISIDPPPAAPVQLLKSEPEKPKKVTKRSRLDKKFIRDGARYVCYECNARFFTRNEVEACFDKHFEEEEAAA